MWEVHKIKKTNRRRSYPSRMLTLLGTTQDFCLAKPLNGISLGTNIRARKCMVLSARRKFLNLTRSQCKSTLNGHWSRARLNFTVFNMTKMGKENWKYQTSNGQRAKFEKKEKNRGLGSSQNIELKQREEKELHAKYPKRIRGANLKPTNGSEAQDWQQRLRDW